MTARKTPPPIPVAEAVARLREAGPYMGPNAPYLEAVLDALECNQGRCPHTHTDITEETGHA